MGLRGLGVQGLRGLGLVPQSRAEEDGVGRAVSGDFKGPAWAFQVPSGFGASKAGSPQP